MIDIDILLTGLDAAMHDEAEDAPRTILREALALAHEEGKLSVLVMLGAKDDWPNPYLAETVIEPGDRLNGAAS